MHNYNVAIAVLVGAVIVGCSVSYEHEAFIREAPPVKVGGIEISTSLRPTSKSKIGTKTGGPWRLNIVSTGAHSGAVLKVLSAKLQTDGKELVIVDSETVQELIFYAPTDTDPGYLNQTLDKELYIPFSEGKEVMLELNLIVVEGKQATKIEVEARFKGKIYRGREKFNPIFDVT